ncbi:ATP-binding protein [Blastococcus mobilis]|uniref:AAA domain-containing protein n=1 Tax=Blastococcus mobilis TaxID=1938746 RepID=A0A238VEC0_9ACTN|nr:ATP-binding protein [Blastococcus mobilis]SNR32752.1 AAA domain-containing protein [Blastococcus mobilis]
MSFTFTPAAREGSFARIALAGPSGSGKTWTALTTARELADRVAVIDTERGSAKKYAGDDGFTFDVLEMTHFDPRDLVKALAAAGAAGYGCVVVDSLSHFWMGSGGMLEQVDNAAKRSAGGNSFGGWKEARPMERQMIEALLGYPGHVVVTMRTKTEWVIEENEKGKKVPRKIGTKPEQREGIEYEFDLVGDMDLEHTLVVSKSRILPLADAVVRRPDGEFGRQIAKWVGDGVPPKSALEYRDDALDIHVTFEQLGALYREVKGKRLDGAAVIDGTGDTTTLGELIRARGEELKNAHRTTTAEEQPA